MFALPIAIWPKESASPKALSVSRASSPSPSLMADIRANPFNYYLYQDCGGDELGEISDIDNDDDAALSVLAIPIHDSRLSQGATPPGCPAPHNTTNTPPPARRRRAEKPH